MEDVRIAIFGNSFAAKIQLPALAWAAGNRVEGICGRNLEKARETARQFGIERATTDYRELLDAKPQLVIVATPVHLHAPMVRDALQAGAAVLCEKPFAMDATEAAELVAHAEGRLALIGHQLRWNPYRAKIAQWLEEGVLGELWHARATAFFGTPARLSEGPYTWWYDAARGGGMLGAIGSHLIDGLSSLLGDVESVRARLSTYIQDRVDAEGQRRRVTADEHASLWLGLAGGVEATVETSIVVPNGSGLGLELWGSRASVHLSQEEELVLAVHGEAPQTIELDPGIPRFESEGLQAGGAFGRLEALFLRDVVGAVRDGRTELPGAATFADGLRVQAVLDAARKSSAEARPVSL